MKGIIISGGYISPNENIKNYITDDTFVVCADGGYKYALENDILPDAAVGDFDTVDVPDNDKILVKKFKAEKEETDTQLCVDFLVEKGVTDILLFGALGGDRFDHAFANIQLLKYGLKKGAYIEIIDGTTNIFIIENSVAFLKGNIGDTVSVFAVGKAHGISYKGLKYSLSNGDLDEYTPCLGMSNSLSEKEAEIVVKKGTVIIMHIGGENCE